MPETTQTSALTLEQTLERGRLAHEARDFSAAEEAYQAVLEKDPNHGEALHLLGVLFFQLGDLDLSEGYLIKALAADPKNHRYYNTLGLLQRRLGVLDKALDSFSKAITLQPVYAEAFSNMGLVYLQKEQTPKALESFKKAITLNAFNPEMWTNYGHTLRDSNLLEDAAFAYRKALMLAPTSERYILNLAAIELALQNNKAAEELYAQVHAKNPEEPTAKHLLSSLRGEQDCDLVADEYIADLFDSYAPQFEGHLKSLGYRIPEVLGEYIPHKVAPKTAEGNWSLLDLGCGTGACGQIFSKYCTNIVGVDLAREMLKKAEEKGVYTTLYPSSIVPYLHQENAEYDLVLAADVFIYVGPLEEVFERVAHFLKEGGLFGFSTELVMPEEVKDVMLRPSGRYAQKAAYIENLATKNGLEIIIEEDVAIRKDVTGPIPGQLYVLRKS